MTKNIEPMTAGYFSSSYMDECRDFAAETQAELRRTGMAFEVDEVACLLPRDKHKAAEALNGALSMVGDDKRVTYFNRADDKVSVLYLPSKYQVRYHFFTLGDGLRLELMELKEGRSPLHDWYHLESGCFPSNIFAGRSFLVHASFKVPSRLQMQWAETCLEAAGYVCGQSCKSNYGEFSYWRKEDTWPVRWVKVRINTRDVPETMTRESDVDLSEESPNA